MYCLKLKQNNTLRESESQSFSRKKAPQLNLLGKKHKKFGRPEWKTSFTLFCGRPGMPLCF